MLIDYHGFGKSEGTPSEKNLYLDGEASVQWLKKEKNLKSEQIIVFGTSLGGGVSVELATRYRLQGLILEAPFSSTVSIAGSLFPYKYFPVKLMVKDKFDNLSKIDKIHCPVLFIHGSQDTLISKKESEKLHAKAREPKELYLVEGADHNDVPFIDPQEYWQRIKEWIEGLE